MRPNEKLCKAWEARPFVSMESICVGLRLSPLFDNIEFDNIFIPLKKTNKQKQVFNWTPYSPQY